MKARSLFSVKFLFILLTVLFLTACAKSPADQCLDSFRSNLKDPDSGKVVDFTNDILTYTATNSYGARTQGKAICTRFGDEWKRDRNREYIMTLNEATATLNANTKCIQENNSQDFCAGDSIVLKSSPNYNLDALEEETARKLGFE